MMARALIKLVQAYQFLLSPWLGHQCRFSPSCSHYACAALRKYGAWRGGWMTLSRLSRCHPWHTGGYDPLP